jgi:hypothetical protein
MGMIRLGRVSALLVGVLVALFARVYAEDVGESGAAKYSAAALDDWWAPGAGRPFPEYAEYANAAGRIGIINTGGEIDTRDHPFFTAIGSNGRACVTCHQPSDGMSLSLDTIRALWDATQGKDPLFAVFDGADCPDKPAGEASSHSLLLNRGLIRIGMPWPPAPYAPDPVEVEFDIEVVRDPTGCNSSPEWGLNSENPTISVYRRPRPVLNIAHMVELPHGVGPHDKFFYADKNLLHTDPETGEFVQGLLMADARGLTPRNQARDAARNHLELKRPLSESELQAIEQFELQLFGAQSVDLIGGLLDGPGTPPGLGPNAPVNVPRGRLGNNPVNRVFGDFSMWDDAEKSGDEAGAFKASVARGADVFFRKRFYISDVGAYNDKGLGNPFKRSCASGCHNTLGMGMDMGPFPMDLGTSTYPWQNTRDDLPLFKLTCKPGAVSHSYLGPVVYTHDPGRALITGRCRDIGALMTQQMRALSARAPYFANGSAATLRELVDLYDRRFNIGYTDQEKADLINFMRTL